ncbi:histone-lysine N-methyltransferase set-18-like isoform X1 [Macrosteles quadrilineatus]|uniref:histone-lysine N-methyltransferase set-18-like isoform X1 n=1 Tax=Macrosteles quadrilineatus TaxID=74068 RepID=UPI0023E3493F|nr:histone-lysine N-methyltransferase set-18-like isoform X1 [Macrosteles quadrilineatus]
MMGGSDPLCVVCRQKGPLTCSSCKTVSYCSKEHQKHDWPKHKQQCKPYEVKVSKELGRYLVASRDLVAGEVIMEEAPVVAGPKLADPSPVCLGCLRPPGHARCDQCGWPVCSPMCPGLRDPHHHGVECKLLSLSPVTDSRQCRYECILPLRCLLLQKRNPKKWKTIMSLETHIDQRGPSTDVYKELNENVVNYLTQNYLSKLDSSALDDMSPDVIHRICGAIDVNAMEILENDVEVLAILPTASIMCHSCVPNTKHTFRNTRVTVRAAVNIPKGQDVTLMYTHMLWTTQARREHLRNTKYFDCCCPRCSDPTELGTYINALRCLSETSQGNVCGGYQYPKNPLDNNCVWSCDRCPMFLTSQEVCELISSLDVQVENIQLAMYYLGLSYTNCPGATKEAPFDVCVSENQPTVDSLEDLLGKLETVLHPHHYLCYKIKHSLIQLYGHQPSYLHSDLNEKALIRKTDICRDLISVTNKIDQGHGRLGLYSAVLHFELHSALMELYSRRKDISLLREAKASLEEEIAFLPSQEGDNSPEYRMRELAKKALIDVNKVHSSVSGSS